MDKKTKYGRTGVVGVFVDDLRSVYVKGTINIGVSISSIRGRLDKGKYRNSKDLWKLQKYYDEGYGLRYDILGYCEKEGLRHEEESWIEEMIGSGLVVLNADKINIVKNPYPYKEENRGLHDGLERMLDEEVVSIQRMWEYYKKIEESGNR